MITISGVTEAFVHATASVEQLKKFNLGLIICSCCYLGAIIAFVNTFGAMGLIFANALSEIEYSFLLVLLVASV